MKGAIALVTLTRSLKVNPEKLSSELDAHLKYYVNELTGEELAVMMCTLTILAAGSVSSEEMIEFAAYVEREG